MGYVDEFIALGLVSLLGAMSPGPDFAVVTQQSLIYGRKGGIGATIGITLGCIIHLSYCILGIGVIIAESVYLFNILKYLGSFYLIYLGVRGIINSRKPRDTTAENVAVEPMSISLFDAIKKGLIVNLLNPKVTLFFLSVFTQMISPNMPIILQALLGLEFLILGFAWFCFLTWVLTHPALSLKLKKVQHYIERVLGICLVLLGMRVAL